MNKNSSRRFFSLETSLRSREVILLLLLAALAGLSIYVARTDTTSFGLLTRPIEQDFVPVVVNFHTDVLDSEAFLDLNVTSVADGEVVQVEGELIDATVPPGPLTIKAQNARIGTEIVVSWTLPESSLTLYSNLYRVLEPAGTEELIAEHSTETTWKDTTVDANKTYTYTVYTVTQDPSDTEKWYESVRSVETSAVAQDTIAPLAPTNLVVEPIVSEDGENALHLTWTHPEEAEIVHIYRSEVQGSRGALIESVLVTDPSEYTDTTAPENTTVWYTLVSEDASENVSSADFALPVPGNSTPFNYGVLVQ